MLPHPARTCKHMRWGFMQRFPNSEFAPGFSIAGLSLGWSKTAGPWSVKAFARIDNLFDRKHVGSVIVNDANARYYEGAPGKTWVAGMKVSYGL